MGRLIDLRPLSSEGCGLSGAFKFFSEAIMCLQLLKMGPFFSLYCTHGLF